MVGIGMKVGVAAGLASGAAVAAHRQVHSHLARAAAPSQPQTEVPQPVKHVFGAGHYIAAGLRVIEMAQIVAAPIASRSLADWGAEVIKVEPPEGDFLRKFVSADQNPISRETTAIFEIMNVGKLSIQLDVRKADDREDMLKLLESADVFITNVRISKLKSAGLLYEDICDRCPRLVYAHLSGYGCEGPEADRGGVDTGAFWTATGLGAATVGPHMAGGYSPGPGDTITGMFLLAGIFMALLDRDRSTGRGRLVDASLFRSGLWCNAYGIIKSADGFLLEEEAEADNISDYSSAPLLLHDANGDGGEWWTQAFQCGEGEDAGFLWIIVDTSLQSDGDVRNKLFDLLEFQGTRDEVAELSNEEVRANLVKYFEDQESIMFTFVKLREVGVACSQHRSFAEAAGALLDAGNDGGGPLGELYRKTGCVDYWGSRLGIADLAGAPCHPIQFSKGSLHGPRWRAPRKGQHTEAVLRNGFSSAITPPQVLPESAKPSRLPLDGVIIVELSSSGDLSASATCSALAEYGADVTQIRLSAEPATISGAPLEKHFSRSKRVAEIQLLSELLVAADAFVTSVPEEKLEDLGLGLAAIQEFCPSLVIVFLSPFGVHARSFREEANAAHVHLDGSLLGSMWGASGYGGTFQSLEGSKPIPPLPHFLSLAASSFGAAAVAAALFHRCREGVGIGQLVDVSYLRIGLFLPQFGLAMLRHKPNRSAGFAWATSEQEFATAFSPLAMPIFCTSDVQFFIYSDPRAPKLLDLARVAGLSLPSTVSYVALGVLLSLPKLVVPDGVTAAVKMRYLAHALMKEMRYRFRQLSWRDVNTRLTELDVIHNRVAMPAQMLRYTAATQGWAAGLLRSQSEVVLRCPVIVRPVTPARAMSRL